MNKQMSVQGQVNKNVARYLGFLNEANDANFRITQKSIKNLLLSTYFIAKLSLGTRSSYFV